MKKYFFLELTVQYSLGFINDEDVETRAIEDVYSICLFTPTCLFNLEKVTFIYKQKAFTYWQRGKTKQMSLSSLTEKNYWADNSYYSDLEVSIYGQ